MHRRETKLVGSLLLITMFVTMFGVTFSGQPQITGLAVGEIQKPQVTFQTANKFNCGELQHNQCSTAKPLFCDNGNLMYKCTKCGCNQGEHCTENGFCEPIKKCVDNSIYGECSTHLNGKFCNDGTLIHNCNLCGCDQGTVCQENKCVPA